MVRKDDIQSAQIKNIARQAENSQTHGRTSGARQTAKAAP
jgi:hypothetical protein